MSSVLTCNFCTFINETGARVCNACGRTLGLPTINLNPIGVECLQCTFRNPPGSVNCQVCETPILVDGGNSTLAAVNLSIVDEMSTTMAVDVGAACQICYSTMAQDFRMPGCTHLFCTVCAKTHFTIKITECGINNVRCPIDTCSAFDEMPNKSVFFKELKLVLRGILEPNVKKMFTDKVHVMEIMDKPGFLRCTMCNYGFVNQSKTRKTTCPDCFKVFCSKCGKKWTASHYQMTCTPNENRTSDDGSGNVQMHTNAACPQCKYKYFLERGGCMHITCSQCSYEYCEFCFKKITGKGQFCNFPNCSKGQSLHGHHPRNCMYYVRDMDHKQLERLLKNNGVRYTVVQRHKTSACKLKVNVLSDGIWVDAECNKPSLKSYNNMCLTHYKWHLGELMKKHSIDPVDVMNNLECMCELRRNNVNVVLNKASIHLPIEDEHTVALRALVRSQLPYEQILQ
ncbi:E3 ubiquitin-protein ligase RNF31-like isoform X2 [Bradysia coprophila]|uniref:E3 ubiquitin-protein ligase RNF31-like isoform X2 n=1 Tax=Bradysia coprophila TaxID=38358 RepID=UPI00187D88EE|nr:E3 ubiquitin-protein ligase RNF31-like isoform X2 [Bradysia coprophila]